jgi:hypothetical protein
MKNYNTFTVIEIISPMQIVLNCGRANGILEDQKFIVFGLGKKLKDPETGEELEQLEILRGRGKAIHIQDKICTIESYQISDTHRSITRKTNLGTFGLIAGPTEETEIQRRKKPFDEVQIGDKARLI